MWTSFNSLLLSLATRARIARDEAGQAMVEYTIIVGLISVIAITAILAVSGDITPIWEKVKVAMEKA